MEKAPETRETVRERYDALLAYDPRIITYFAPVDKIPQRRAFLRGEIENPNHAYPSLDVLDFDVLHVSIAEIGDSILEHPDLKPKHRHVHERFVEGYHNKTTFLELARRYNHAQTEEDQAECADEYMRLNIEMYGTPDEGIYRTLLQEKLENINKKQLSKRGEALRDELFSLVDFKESGEEFSRFRPSDETIAWVRDMIEVLYGGMLAHIPADKKMFSPSDVQAVFQEIIEQEFDEAAAGWKVDVERATAINVKPAEKRIVIPCDRKDASPEILRQLVVHELGVHMLRSIIGEEGDLDPLRLGLDGYHAAEEGLGVVMDQAVEGEFVESGVGHYITAGLAYHDGMDFRGVYEVKWRLDLLEELDDGKVVTELASAETREKSYNSTLRIFRGTDDLPWFKDLSYYNGAVDMWRHLEKIKGDDTKFMFVLMGKANPANSNHERTLYETTTV